MKWYTKSSDKPVLPVYVDGYAFEMSSDLRETAVKKLTESGFSRSAADKVLVPYVLTYNTNAMYSVFTIGGAFLLASIFCFAMWIKMGMNFKEWSD